MKKILVTGGTGYIGSILANYLYDLGYEVILTERKHKEMMQSFKDKFKFMQMDLLGPASIVGICKDIDVVIHTATFHERMAANNPKNALLANGYGTRLLLEDALREKVKKFIYLSTFHVYGRSYGYIDEDSLVCPVTDYALTHYVGEMYCSQYAKLKGLETIIVRITNGYGSPIFKNIDKWYLALNNFCKTAKEQGKIILQSSGMQLRDFVAIKDVVKAIEILIHTNMDHEKAGIFNISSQQAMTIRGLAEKVAQVYRDRYGKNMIVYTPDTVVEEKKKDLFVDSCKIRALNWKPTTIMNDEINKIFQLLDEGEVNRS